MMLCQTRSGGAAMGTAAAQTIDALWQLYESTAWANLQQKTPDNTVAAELQLAIWKVIAQSQGTGYNVTALNNSTIDTAAQGMVTAAQNYSGSAPNLYAWESTTYQDYIGVPDGGTTLALLGMAFTGMALLRRKN